MCVLGGEEYFVYFVFTVIFRTHADAHTGSIALPGPHIWLVNILVNMRCDAGGFCGMICGGEPNPLPLLVFQFATNFLTFIKPVDFDNSYILTTTNFTRSLVSR